MSSLGFDPRRLTGNALKFIAAISMVIDHIGYLIFPKVVILRIIGRLAFPIFAFMISEGAKYTKNRLRYLLTLSGFAAVIQVVYYVYSNSLKMSVMVTFTLAVCMIYALDLLKEKIFSPTASAPEKLISLLVLPTLIIAVRLINDEFDIDYGFWGCMLPVFASLLVAPKQDAPAFFSVTDQIPFRVTALGVGLLLLYLEKGGILAWAFLALPVLMLYSGKRGTLKTKYFFYFFYPLHLVILQGIDMLIDKFG